MKTMWISCLLQLIIISGTIAFADNSIVLDKPFETVALDIVKAMKNRKTERNYTNQII